MSDVLATNLMLTALLFLFTTSPINENSSLCFGFNEVSGCQFDFFEARF